MTMAMAMAAAEAAAVTEKEKTVEWAFPLFNYITLPFFFVYL